MKAPPQRSELVHGCAFETRAEAFDAISGYIENYFNAKRRHSAAENMSPNNFELAQTHQLAAWSSEIFVREIRGTPDLRPLGLEHRSVYQRGDPEASGPPSG